MLKWVQSGLSAVAGTAEPVYGPEAIHAITDSLAPGQNPYADVEKADLEWRDLSFTNVETQVFYLTLATGHVCFVQIILSNLAGIHTTSQFTCRIYHPDKPEESIWTSTHLNDYKISDDRVSFAADDLSVTLSEDLSTYTIKSDVNEKSIVDIKISRVAPGFKIGKDGVTKYGTDAEHPWGTMRHIFWPRASVSGSLVANGVALPDISGTAMFVMALQGMKPQHCAARWNFANFQGPTISAVMMEFTTPPSYGSKVVNIGCVVKGDKILAATVENTAEHTKTLQDSENDWPAPTEVKFEWKGTSPDTATPLDAVIAAPIPNLVERVDVMAEIPAFVKKIVAGVAGTKPYIYQYSNPADIKVTFGADVLEESGSLYNEATFIS
ncbi:oxidative stress survival, Svf1-like protein [Limtongia smithiae]|uniref:oxidative stress survival, Svf1-like protein n=1 Tax=Limtongia smithiae TaxID=1125753 RepID=UPI0034CED1ED